MEFVTVMNLCGGGWIKGHKILSIQELAEISKQESISIIVAMANPDSVEQVLKTLEHYGMSNVECYTYFALKLTIEFHINDDRIGDVYRKNFNNAKMACMDQGQNSRDNVKHSCFFLLMLYDPILIWQPGKVGSLSLLKSLEEINVHCIHTHHLSEGLDLKRKYLISDSDKKRLDYRLLSYYNDRLLLLDDLEKVKIISLVREPISRSISHYFQHFETDRYYVCEADYDESVLDVYQKTIAYVERETRIGNYGFLFEWFNYEIKRILSIDVYQHDFDKERGYQVIHQDNVELLLIKTEKLNDCQEVIGEFVEAENFKLVNANVGNQKPYKFVYDEVKKSIQIPEHIINFYYKGNKAMDHFYTEEEKENFIRKWTRK